jgi:hypothetical protein
VAIAIGIVAAVIHYFRAAENGGLSDFSTVWYGGKLLLEGQNPYDLIGPHKLIGLPSSVFYPVPALVVALPFTILPVHWAGTIFVFTSAALLAFGATRDGWYLLPIFPSISFFTSAQLGQWSMLMTAAAFIPALSFLAVAKPQAALPVIAASRQVTTWIAGFIGAIVLVIASFVLLPGWFASWWHALGTSDYFKVPVATMGGVAIALVMLRWRRPEAWLVFIAAAVPQTWYPYNGLVLLIVAATYREACFLSLVSSAGWLAAYLFFVGGWRSAESRFVLSSVLVALCYLPATLLILRRPNVGPSPLWITWLTKAARDHWRHP